MATYASISSSETCANRTWVAADLASHTSRWVSITQCPVWSTPARPRICCQRSIASSSLAGLPRISPSRASTESQPMTMARFSVGGHGDRLELRQLERVVGRGRHRHRRLVDAADHHLGGEAGVLQGLQPGRRCRGEDQPWSGRHPGQRPWARHAPGPWRWVPRSLRWCADHSGLGRFCFEAASAAPAAIAETTDTSAAISSGVGSPLTMRRRGGCSGASSRAHNGMFPCFFGGSVSRLEASRRRARTTSMRVSCGVITASM